MAELLPSRKAAKILGVHANTLRHWADTNRIRHIVTESGHRRYDVSTLVKSEGRRICYCRVSSAKQAEDLRRQEDELRASFPTHEIISDIGSGVNPRRKGLQTILELAMQRRIEEVVVTYRDRLSRNAYEFLEFLVAKAGGRIVVLYTREAKSKEQQLSEELIAVIHNYSGKAHGKRRKSPRKKGPAVPVGDTAAAPEPVVCDGPSGV